MRALRVVLPCSLAMIAGCLSPPALPPRGDAGARDSGIDAWLPTFEVLGVEVADGHGRLWPRTGTPRRPSIAVRFSSAPADPSLVLLLEGAADADLLDDLDATPLRVSTLERAIEVEATLSGGTLTLVPLEPLEAAARVTVAVPRWLTDHGAHRLAMAFTSELTVSTRLDAGARATDAWPPDGAFEVAPALALAAIRFDGALEDPAHAVVLSDARGPVAASAMLTPCASIGWREGTCVMIVPVASLASATSYGLAVASAARDATGMAMPAFGARFTTAASAPAPLSWASTACSLGETEVSAGCARADDESITFHGQLSAAARVTWTAGAASGGLVAPRGTISLRVGDLVHDTAISLALDATDYAGLVSPLTLPITTTEPLPTIGITEIRADPAGPEPRQEYVEIENYGAMPVSLAGMSLADSASSMGDALPSVTIPAFSHALLVSSGFDPDETAGGADVAAPAGAILVHLDASLGSGGLSNAGEPLFLRDALGRWVSAAPSSPAPRSGVCIVRVSPSHRTGEVGSFEYDAALTCTPGR
jgi:hypothetical protein